MDQLEKCLKKSCGAAAGAPGTGEHNETAAWETGRGEAKEEGRDEVEEEERLLKASANIGDVGQTRGKRGDRSSRRRTGSVTKKDQKIKGCHFESRGASESITQSRVTLQNGCP